jgi:ubiquitin-conjugating enzyme E2 G2
MQNPPEGIVAGPIDESNFFEWDCLITGFTHKLFTMYIYAISGPEGTCFENGVFTARLTFSEDYPLSPPKMQFTCDIFHPNICKKLDHTSL